MDNRIREWRKERGLTLAKLAEAVGTTDAQIQKLETGAIRLSVDWLKRIAPALGVRQADLLKEEDPVYDLPGMRSITVRGAVQAGHWAEAVEWPVLERFAIAAPVDDRWAHHTVSGFLVRGDSMDEVYPDGTILIVVPMVELERWPEPGERVIVQRRNNLGEYEATVKEFVVDKYGKFWLSPRSSNPEHRVPIRLPRPDPNHDENGGFSTIEDIHVIALVIASYRPERPLGPMTSAD